MLKTIAKTAGALALVGGLLVSPWSSLAQTQSQATMRPVIQGLTAPTVLSVNQEGTWKVNASDPKNGSLSYSVDWGDAPMTARSAVTTPFVQSSSFTHTYATTGTYTVKFTVKNEAGGSAGTSATVYVVKGQSSSSLEISKAQVKAISPTMAEATWNTNLRADSRAWIGTADPVDTSGDADILRQARISHHDLMLKNLKPDTTYYVVVGSGLKNGEPALSSQMTFKTPPASNHKGPTISSVDGPQSLQANEEGTWTLKASDPKNGSLSYSVDWGDMPSGTMLRSASQPVFTQTATFSHAYANAGTYHIVFTAKNEAGVSTTASASVTVSEAQNPVTISDVSVSPSDTNADQAVATWTTNVPADSSIWFSTMTPVDTTAAPGMTDAGSVTNHSLTLTGLEASSTYFYVVGSKDATGNIATSQEASFSTGMNSGR